MDNVWFQTLTEQVMGICEWALISIISLLGIILGATVGYQLYQGFTTGVWKGKRGEYDEW